MLPIVEFVLEEGITHEEAVQLMQSEEGLAKSGAVVPSAPRWEEEKSINFQSLKINDDDADSYGNQAQYDTGAKMTNVEDPFTIKMTFDEQVFEYTPVVVNRSVLRQMNSADVLITKECAPLKVRYFRNLVPDMQITMCTSCNKVRVTAIRLLTQRNHCANSFSTATNSKLTCSRSRPVRSVVLTNKFNSTDTIACVYII